jgi:hypothetical protein
MNYSARIRYIGAERGQTGLERQFAEIRRVLRRTLWRREWSNLSPMPGLRQGSLHLFRVSGIDVFLHWSWFVIAIYEIGARQGRYSSYAWSALEYMALFVIVLLHEFGHALRAARWAARLTASCCGR